MVRTNRSTTRIRINYYRVRGRTLLEGGGNITGMLLGHMIYVDTVACGRSTDRKPRTSLKPDLFQIYSYILAFLATSIPPLLFSLALNPQ